MAIWLWQWGLHESGGELHESGEKSGWQREVHVAPRVQSERHIIRFSAWAIPAGRGDEGDARWGEETVPRWIAYRADGAGRLRLEERADDAGFCDGLRRDGILPCYRERRVGSRCGKFVIITTRAQL